MNLTTLILVGHLLGAVLGVGGATVSDVMTMRMFKDRKITDQGFRLFEAVTRIVIAGLTLSILTGAWLLYSNWSLITDPAMQTKITIVVILVINGAILHLKVMPLLHERVNKSLAVKKIRSKLWLLALTGAFSAVSWYSILLLGTLLHFIDWPYLFLINLYLLLVAVAAFSSFFMLRQIIFGDQLADDRTQSGDRTMMRLSKTWLSGAAVVVLLMVAGSIGGYVWLSPETQPTVHQICIGETPPWFKPEVLEIEVGDEVVWEHCDETEFLELSSQPLPILLTKHAQAHNGHDDGNHYHSDNHYHVHTHPVMSISGPEAFSSGFAQIGHLADGAEFRHTFTEVGVYEYICPTHPYMKGVIAVGESAPTDSLWPPEEIIKPADLPPPKEPGIGEIWVNTQFERVPEQEFPGTITVINAETWEIEEVIADDDFNNPHNLWNSPDNRYIFQTQWHSDKFSKIDIETREVLATATLGNAPAHLFVHPNRERVYVTLNNESRVVILDYELNVINEIKTSFGPHGIWIDPDGRWMSVAATLEEKLDIIDLETEQVVATFEAPGLPLATQITNDGRYAMISLLLEGVVRFIDLETMEFVADVEVGEMPIWAMPEPTGNYVLIPNTGSADISVIELDNLEVRKTIPAAGGAHGIAFGEKADGGYYGYFSNKFARVVGVVDMDTLDTIGYIQLDQEQWGGNGILTLPNPYDDL